MKIGEKLTFVNFMKKITDGLAKIIFRQDVMGGGMGGGCGAWQMYAFPVPR